MYAGTVIRLLVAYFGSCGHVFGYLGPSGLKQRLILRSVHPNVCGLRGQLPHPLVVNVGSLQKGIEVVVLSSLMMVTVARCTSDITAGALRVLNKKEQTKIEDKKN